MLSLEETLAEHCYEIRLPIHTKGSVNVTIAFRKDSGDGWLEKMLKNTV